MNSVPIVIDDQSKVKLYYQIYSQLAEQIASGKIVAGERLPSIRTVAETVGIGRNTVVKAYSMLEDDGYIFSYEKSGFFVKDKNSAQLMRQDPEKEEESPVPTVGAIFRQRMGTDTAQEPIPLAGVPLNTDALQQFTELIEETKRPATTATTKETVMAQQPQEGHIATDTETVDEKFATIMSQIRQETESTDDGTSTLTQGELDSILRSGTVTESAPGQSDFETHTDINSAIDMGTDEDILPQDTDTEGQPSVPPVESPFGEEHFRVTVTEFLDMHKKLNCTPSQLVAGANIEELIANTLQVLSGLHKSTATQERPRGLLRLARLAEAGLLHSEPQKTVVAIPDGDSSLQFIQDVGFDVKEVFCDLYGVVPEELSGSGANVLILTTTPASAKRQQELLNWLHGSKNRYIIEYDKESNGAIPALQGTDSSGRILYAGSAQDLIPGKYHASWIFLPPSILYPYTQQFSAEEMELSPAEQQKLVDFIESGELDQYMQREDF